MQVILVSTQLSSVSMHHLAWCKNMFYPVTVRQRAAPGCPAGVIWKCSAIRNESITKSIHHDSKKQYCALQKVTLAVVGEAQLEYYVSITYN